MQRAPPACHARYVDQLPIDSVTAQLESEPELQRWYLHLIFTHHADLYNHIDFRRLHERQVGRSVGRARRRTDGRTDAEG